ncbi:MAG: hypothetical protein AB1449_14705 [Chloroflexota bacterium]
MPGSKFLFLPHIRIRACEQRGLLLRRLPRGRSVRRCDRRRQRRLLLRPQRRVASFHLGPQAFLLFLALPRRVERERGRGADQRQRARAPEGAGRRTALAVLR